MFSFAKLMPHSPRFWLRGIQSFTNRLLPPLCLFCGFPSQQAVSACRPCQEALPMLTHSCQKCASTLHGKPPTTLVCGACLSEPPPFDRSFALFAYAPPIIRLITALKFQRQFSHAALLGAWLSQHIQQEWYQNTAYPDCLLPVPLHHARLQERGFNQALEIARPIHAALGIPLDTHGVLRSRATQAQSGLSASARKINMKNAFTAQKNYHGQHIAILDDVMTTGHTISALSQALRRAGARQIDVWCAARAGSYCP